VIDRSMDALVWLRRQLDTSDNWFALDFLEALECEMLVRFGDYPSTTSSSANWREPTTTWTATKQLPRPIRVLSASRKTHTTLPLRTATLGTGAVAQMVSGQGFSAFPRRGRADLFPGSGGCELVAVDFE
jgi:hypothetical protein